jgi:dUTP pyrophosphatase
VTTGEESSAVTILQIPIARLRPGVALPARLSTGAAGVDLPAAVEDAIVIAPGRFAQIPCGFALAIPSGYEAQVRPRSGLAARHGVTVLNAPGTIDSDYRGEVSVLLVNLGPQPFTVTPGMRIAQLVVAPVTRVEWAETAELPPTERGTGGFGHTGT